MSVPCRVALAEHVQVYAVQHKKSHEGLAFDWLTGLPPQSCLKSAAILAAGFTLSKGEIAGIAPLSKNISSPEIQRRPAARASRKRGFKGVVHKVGYGGCIGITCGQACSAKYQGDSLVLPCRSCQEAVLITSKGAGSWRSCHRRVRPTFLPAAGEDLPEGVAAQNAGRRF